MKKVLLSIFFVFSLFLSFGNVYASTDWSNGLLDTVPFTFTGNGNIPAGGAFFDNSDTYGSSFREFTYYTFKFNRSVDIGRLSMKLGIASPVIFKFYDADKVLIKTFTINSSFIDNQIIDVLGVTYIDIVNDTYYGVQLFEIDFFEKRFSLPAPVLVTSSTVKTIDVSWDSIVDVSSYNVYLNGTMVDTVDSSVLNYRFTGLNQDTNYTVKVEAVPTKINFDTNFSNAVVRTKPYFSGTPSGVANVGMNNALLSWSPVADTKYYEVRLGSGSVFQTTNLQYLFDGLTMETDYTAYVRQVNVADIYSEWKAINFTTLGIPETPPDKPDNVTLISKGLDFIEVEVSDVLWADNYLFYINNALVVTQSDRVYRFTGLMSNTAYGISVKSSNQYGDSRFGAYLGVRTDSLPLPTVTGASVKPVSGGSGVGSGTDLTKQNLTWQSENVTGGYKIIIDGEEVATVGNDVNSYSIDFASLGLTGDKHSIEVVPLDDGGKSFKLENVYTKGLGNADLDTVTFDLLSGLDMLKKAGMYLIILIIGVLITFLAILFIFNKMKLNLATNDDSSLEANPDGQIQTIDKKNKFDKDAYYVAKTLESRHISEKHDDFNFKSLLNDIFNGGSKYKSRSYGGKSYKGRSYKSKSYEREPYGVKFINTKDGKGRYSGLPLEPNYDKHNPYNSRFDELKEKYDKTK